MRRRRGLGWGLVVLLSVVAGGCGESFDPPSYLDDLRVLALSADPLRVVVAEGGPGAGEVSATAHVVLPPDAAVAREEWRFCAASAGAFAGYECLFPEVCEVDVTDGAERVGDGTAFSRVTLDVLALGAPCAARLAAEEGASDVPGGLPGGGGDGDGAEAPEELVVEVLLFYRVETEDGAEREAVLRLPVWLVGEPETPNQPPVIERVEWEGAAVAEGDTVAPVAEEETAELTVVVAPDSLDPYVDEAGRDRTEEAIVSVFATAGRFEVDREVGTDTTIEWEARELEEGETAADVYVVVRDLRGGQTVFGPVHVPIERAPGADGSP